MSGDGAPGIAERPTSNASMNWAHIGLLRPCLERYHRLSRNAVMTAYRQSVMSNLAISDPKRLA